VGSSRVLYLKHCAQGRLLDNNIGVKPLDSLPLFRAIEGRDDPMPLGLHLRMLHAWSRGVPHDVEGRREGLPCFEGVLI
jgi:hypothetical protein